MATVLDELIGRSVREIRMNEEYLVFDTDQGELAYLVVGDCCSYSYFHDFFGVAKLLANGPVTKVEYIDRSAIPDIDKIKDKYEEGYGGDDCVEVYGLRMTTMDPIWGEVSSVVSFRNVSNGYYGGWMQRAGSWPNNLPVLFEDYYGD